MESKTTNTSVVPVIDITGGHKFPKNSWFIMELNRWGTESEIISAMQEYAQRLNTKKDELRIEVRYKNIVLYEDVYDADDDEAATYTMNIHLRCYLLEAGEWVDADGLPVNLKQVLEKANTSPIEDGIANIYPTIIFRRDPQVGRYQVLAVHKSVQTLPVETHVRAYELVMDAIAFKIGIDRLSEKLESTKKQLLNLLPEDNDEAANPLTLGLVTVYEDTAYEPVPESKEEAEKVAQSIGAVRYAWKKVYDFNSNLVKRIVKAKRYRFTFNK